MVSSSYVKRSSSSKKWPQRKASTKIRARPYARTTRTVAIARPAVGMGMSATTILRTSFFANVTATAGTGVFTGYLKPGSCFDPSGDIAAMQPQMFDQFAAMYNRYKVNSCKIRMKIFGNGAAAANIPSWVAAAYPAIDSTPLATYQAAASQQYAKTTSGCFCITGGVGVGTEGKYLTFDLNQDRVVGVKSDAWDVGALVTSDPTALQYMLLPFFLQGSAAGSHTFTLEVDMWQNVTFSQKKNTVDA